jgi:hypothetical protein
MITNIILDYIRRYLITLSIFDVSCWIEQSLVLWKSRQQKIDYWLEDAETQNLTKHNKNLFRNESYLKGVWVASGASAFWHTKIFKQRFPTEIAM